MKLLVSVKSEFGFVARVVLVRWRDAWSCHSYVSVNAFVRRVVCVAGV